MISESPRALARIRGLEQERAAVSRVLRDETAQVLGSILVYLASAREIGDAAGSEDVDELRAAVRIELERVLELAANVTSSPRGRGLR